MTILFMPDAISPWAVSANSFFASPGHQELFRREISPFIFTGFVSKDSLYIKTTLAGKDHLVFRVAYVPTSDLNITDIQATDNKLKIKIKAAIGQYSVGINFLGANIAMLHYNVTLQPAGDLLIPFWPRDIIIPNQSKKDAGKIWVKQIGTRTGQLYFHTKNQPKAGPVLYLQNLTDLAEYCDQTETSAAEVVGGEWPELGLALPPTIKNKPLKAGRSVTINDAYIALDDKKVADETSIVKQYLLMLSEIYLQLPRPKTTYKHWPEILDKGLKDLITSPGCWSQVDGHHYFNAYICDYKTPPEIMVQLAVLLPLLDYAEWSRKELEVMERIRDGLPAFYSKKYGTIMRWHPKVAEQLEAEEEQKKPLVMDSWYLHHPLLNLSRLALKGDKAAKRLFLDSLEFAVKVAHHFNYQWPVFYKIDTLEVLKAETQPGKGGEKDVPGLYALIMLQAWELTHKKRYLAEAERSAKQLRNSGFELFYQANNTAFAAGAMLRLYKITKKTAYLDLSYLCMANVFKNVRLWDCKYGYGKNYPSFFTLFPLNDAPYSAVYEEQEVFCAFHDYLCHTEGTDIYPPVRLLIAEYIRYLVERAVYYYPPMLPAEMLQEKPKIGEIDTKLWIALEDLQDGWEKSGQIGQEVYGAGNAFGILPRHYMHVKSEEFMVFTNYPTKNFSAYKSKPVKFSLAGDERLTAQLLLLKTGQKKLPVFKVKVNGKLTMGKPANDGRLEYCVPGNAEIIINW